MDPEGHRPKDIWCQRSQLHSLSQVGLSLPVDSIDPVFRDIQADLLTIFHPKYMWGTLKARGVTTKCSKFQLLKVTSR